ncbi:MAG: serine/threonine protein kinase [Deltaproteobacteria bacterium]|nr:serine/threonine protein kinase [Deltaproteobacteria bacterium]
MQSAGSPDLSPTGAARASAPAIAEGQVVAGRFQVGQRAAQDSLGTLYQATDQKTGKAVTLRVLAAGLVDTAPALERFRAEVKTAAALTHRNLVGVYGMGTDATSGAKYVATELIEGAPLSSLIEARRAAGGFSLRAAYNVVVHVCHALEAVHLKSAHGAVRPSVVFVNTEGRVRLADLGVARGALLAAGPRAMGDATEQAYLAPEVKMGKEPTPSADVFGVGAILYALLTGRSPIDEFVHPSRARSDVPPEIDDLLMSCLGPDATQRFQNVAAILNAMQSLLARTAMSADEVAVEDAGLEVAVDLGSIAPPAPAAMPSAPSAPFPDRPRGDGPRVGARISIHDQFRPSGPGAAPAAAPQGPTEVDLADMLRQITENDAERWLVQKDKLDHGPYTGRDVVQRILKGEALGQHLLINMDTGEKRKISDWPEFAEFAEQYRMKKARLDHEAAVKRVEKSETRSGAAKIVVAVGALALIAAAVAVYALTRGEESRSNLSADELAELYERGEVRIGEGQVGILPPPVPGQRRGGGGGGGARRSGGGGGGGGGGAGGSYEEAMNRAQDLGDVTQGGGSERQLTPAQVASTMNRSLGSLNGCISAELRSGGSPGTVRIDLAISGDGRVLGASVRSGSPQFRSCVSSRVRNIRFPTFPAPRMGARFQFSVD